MRRTIFLIVLCLLVTTRAAGAQSADEYGERTPDMRGIDVSRLSSASVSVWVSVKHSFGLLMEAYGYNEPFNGRPGYPFTPGFPNRAYCPCSAAVVEFKSPVVLGAKPVISFEVRYKIQGNVPGTSTKPFVRVQYADGDFVTIPIGSFSDKYLGAGWYEHTLEQPFPFPAFAVQRIAVLARPDSIQGAHFWVRNIKISPSGSGPIQINQVMQNFVRANDPLISFVY